MPIHRACSEDQEVCAIADICVAQTSQMRPLITWSTMVWPQWSWPLDSNRRQNHLIAESDVGIIRHDLSLRGWSSRGPAHYHLWNSPYSVCVSPRCLSPCRLRVTALSAVRATYLRTYC